MTRTSALMTVVLLGLTACGNGDPEPPADAPGTPAAAPAELGMPGWMDVDHDAETVSIHLTAGETSANNYWNFNGLYGGDGGITVPEGYEVTIVLTNEDPAMGHSVGVGERQASYPNQFSEVVPVFDGAVTSNPRSMTESTLPGEEESITFVANQAGDFALICYVTGHAATGMWLPFTVSADGEVGALM